LQASSPPLFVSNQLLNLCPTLNADSAAIHITDDLRRGG
jgi:hypothetical protein